MNKGSKHSPETIKRMSLTHKIKGTPWLVGRKMPEATRLKISESNKKIVHTKEWNNKLKGNNSHLWKGGISQVNRSLRENIGATIEYKNWRKAVFERDNFTCQECKQIGNKLNADHIEAFSIIMRKHNVDSVQRALVCTDLWNIENGRTLCVKCHRKTDNYGGGSKKKQFEYLLR